MNDKQIIQEFHQWAAANGFTPHSTVGNESVDLVANWFIEKFSSYKSEVEKKIEDMKKHLDKRNGTYQEYRKHNDVIDSILTVLRSDN